MSNLLAPIALFVYNRPEHTRKAVKALLKNIEAGQSDLFIFSDAAKDESAEEGVTQVRNYIHQITGFKTVIINERESNMGLANSIIDGVTELCSKYQRVIVLEDDLEVSEYFLDFMNSMLNLYKTSNDIGAISGYMFPVNLGTESVFRQIPHSWGWGTWERAWALMEPDGGILLSRLEEQKKTDSFNRLGHQPMLKMLKNQIDGKNNSWYVRWAASLYLEDRLTVMPAHSLVKNIGIDGSGTHCAYWRFNPYDVVLLKEPVQHKQPNEIKVNSKKEKILRSTFRKIRAMRYVNFIYRTFAIGKYALKMKR